MEAIEVENVSRYYGKTQALEDISFSLNDGSFTLLLGPNGSGKTTLLRCMLGLLKFEGVIRIFGYDVKKQGKEVRKNVGYLPQTVNLYSDMTCFQVIDFFSDLRGIDVTLEETLGAVGLLDKAHVKVGALSGGMKQRLSLAVALLGNPRALLLDEPFSNMDALSRTETIGIMRRLKESGKTIIISTHTLSGLLTMADNVIVLDRGKVLGIMKSEEILKTIPTAYRIYIQQQYHIIDSSAEEISSPTNGWTIIKTHNLQKTLSNLMRLGIDMSSVIIEEPNVDELIMKLSAGGV
ncbi:MAG: ABC transporter ATP-binding protein [Aigarchaeota archaeon]|nr:ABC transporter ATP-binding protein [Candidatus Pelearchaeum maunauluense]